LKNGIVTSRFDRVKLKKVDKSRNRQVVNWGDKSYCLKPTPWPTIPANFTGVAKSKLTVDNISPLVWLAEVLEVYNVDTCTDYPNTHFSEMSKIKVKIKNTTPQVTWSVSSGDPACGVTTTVVTQGGRNGAVDIYY
jgi:hypothetical protein